jgi:hypothetical protein
MIEDNPPARVCLYDRPPAGLLTPIGRQLGGKTAKRGTLPQSIIHSVPATRHGAEYQTKR